MADQIQCRRFQHPTEPAHIYAMAQLIPCSRFYVRLVPKKKEEYVKFGCVRTFQWISKRENMPFCMCLCVCVLTANAASLLLLVCCCRFCSIAVVVVCCCCYSSIDCAPFYALRAEKSTCNISSSLILCGLL